MDRADLTKDVFVEEVGHTAQYLGAHQAQVKLYGGIALVLVVLGLGYYFYSSSKATERQSALAAAMKVDGATVGPNTQPPLLNFSSLDEKNKARLKAYTDLAAKFPGTQEGAIAQLMLAAMQVTEGKLVEAEKAYRTAVDSAPAEYASVAAVALSQVLVAQDKNADAEKVLKTLVDNPTAFVSKEEATVYLAQVIGKSRPADARKLLEPLRTARSVISRAAIQALSDLEKPAAN